MEDINLKESLNLEDKNYIEEFTNIQLLDLFVRYLDNKLNLKDNPNVILICKKDFTFECKSKDNLETIDIITLDELMNSCNSIICDDKLFLNKDELILTLEESIGGKFALSKEIWSRFKITCIEY